MREGIRGCFGVFVWLQFHWCVRVLFGVVFARELLFLQACRFVRFCRGARFFHNGVGCLGVRTRQKGVLLR